MNAFLHHFAYEFRTGFRQKQLLMMNYLFPLGFYLLMGFIMSGINPTFQEDMIPAMLVFSTLSAASMGIPIVLSVARENGIFRSYKINGVPAISILLTSALNCVIHPGIVAVCITFSAPLLFGASIPQNWPLFGLVFILLVVNSASLSIFIGVLSPNSRVAILASQLIFVTSTLLGGLMLPHKMLPSLAKHISKMLPAAHAMNAFNSLAMGKEPDFSPWGSVAVLLLGSLLAFALAVHYFNWDQAQAARRKFTLIAAQAFLPYIAVALFLK